MYKLWATMLLKRNMRSVGWEKLKRRRPKARKRVAPIWKRVLAVRRMIDRLFWGLRKIANMISTVAKPSPKSMRKGREKLRSPKRRQAWRRKRSRIASSTTAAITRKTRLGLKTSVSFPKRTRKKT